MNYLNFRATKCLEIGLRRRYFRTYRTGLNPRPVFCHFLDVQEACALIILRKGCILATDESLDEMIDEMTGGVNRCIII